MRAGGEVAHCLPDLLGRRLDVGDGVEEQHQLAIFSPLIGSTTASLMPASAGLQGV